MLSWFSNSFAIVFINYLNYVLSSFSVSGFLSASKREQLISSSHEIHILAGNILWDLLPFVSHSNVVFELFCKNIHLLCELCAFIHFWHRVFLLHQRENNRSPPLMDWREIFSRQYVNLPWEDGIYCYLFDAERKPDTKNEWKHVIHIINEYSCKRIWKPS